MRPHRETCSSATTLCGLARAAQDLDASSSGITFCLAVLWGEQIGACDLWHYKWRLHPSVVKHTWAWFRDAEVNLFVNRHSTVHCGSPCHCQHTTHGGCFMLFCPSGSFLYFWRLWETNSDGHPDSSRPPLHTVVCRDDSNAGSPALNNPPVLVCSVWGEGVVPIMGSAGMVLEKVRLMTYCRCSSHYETVFSWH